MCPVWNIIAFLMVPSAMTWQSGSSKLLVEATRVRFGAKMGVTLFAKVLSERGGLNHRTMEPEPGTRQHCMLASTSMDIIKRKRQLTYVTVVSSLNIRQKSRAETVSTEDHENIGPGITPETHQKESPRVIRKASMFHTGHKCPLDMS